MSTIEIKSEIQKIIDSVPENLLSLILDYFTEFQFQVEKLDAESFLSELNGKYNVLLSKLAQ